MSASDRAGRPLPAARDDDLRTYASTSELRVRWRRFRRNRLAAGSAFVLLTLLLMALLAPVINEVILGVSPEEIDAMRRLEGSSRDHLLGTDELGRDVLARLLMGARVSLTIGIMVMIVAVVIGVAVGGMAGYFGGLVDSGLMRVTDTLLATPTFYILLAMTAAVGALSIGGIALIIALTSWMGTARIVRAEILSLRERDFVTAARMLGARDVRVLIKHILPNAMPTVIVAGTLGVGIAILVESSLSYLGLGVQPPNSSWGTMLRNAQFYVWRAPLLAVYPGVGIMVAVLCFNFIGDGLREAFDARLAKRA